VDVFGHDHVGGDDEVVAEADLFEGVLEEIAGRWGAEIREPVITAEGDEVEVTSVLNPDEVGRHGEIVAEGPRRGSSFGS
jgi:hypothetical protein